MRPLNTIAAVVVALAATGAAQAESVSSVLDIVWDDATSGLVVDDTIIISEDVLSIDAITVTIAHSWSNDLDITVNGFVNWDLMFNEGGSSDMGDGLGYGLDNALPYTFVPPGTPGAFTTFGLNDPNPSGLWEANSWNNDGFAAGTAFNLQIVDLFEFDGGAVASWTIEYTPLPGPGALALLGLAGVVSSRRRNR